MKEFWKAIDGRKTFIVSGVIAIMTFAKLVGWIGASEFETVMGFLGAMGLLTVRDAIRKAE